MCPYYFHLVPIFCSRAGIVTAGRTDHLCGRNAGMSRYNYGSSNCATDVEREAVLGDENDAAVIDGESGSSLTNVERTPLGLLLA